ncbi:MAG: hypothetical protein ACLFSI_08895, partial [Halorhodospira sp.]
PYDRDVGIPPGYDWPSLRRLKGAKLEAYYVIPSAGLLIVRIGEAASDWDDAPLPNTPCYGCRKRVPAGGSKA